MSESRKYTAWDNSDREEFYGNDGNLETTHVDRYDWSGNYTHTDVYNSNDEKIDSFKKWLLSKKVDKTIRLIKPPW